MVQESGNVRHCCWSSRNMSFMTVMHQKYLTKVGMNPYINAKPRQLSGGQKQRLALAIALVSDKDIYVFDEATSNIDIDSESIIMNNIKTLSGNRSVIVISHRLANVVPADNIYYMEDGEIKESGAHDELMAANKGYARLYNTQKTLEQGYTEAIS